MGMVCPGTSRSCCLDFPNKVDYKLTPEAEAPISPKLLLSGYFIIAMGKNLRHRTTHWSAKGGWVDTCGLWEHPIVTDTEINNHRKYMSLELDRT